MNTEFILKNNNKNQKKKRQKKNKPQKTTYMYIGLEVSEVAAFLFWVVFSSAFSFSTLGFASVEEI